MFFVFLHRRAKHEVLPIAADVGEAVHDDRCPHSFVCRYSRDYVIPYTSSSERATVREEYKHSSTCTHRPCNISTATKKKEHTKKAQYQYNIIETIMTERPTKNISVMIYCRSLCRRFNDRPPSLSSKRSSTFLAAMLLLLVVCNVDGFQPPHMRSVSSLLIRTRNTRVFNTFFDDEDCSDLCDVDDNENKNDNSRINNNNSNDQALLLSSLSQRIQEIQEEENQEAARQEQELFQRMKRVQESEKIQHVLESTTSPASSSSSSTSRTMQEEEEEEKEGAPNGSNSTLATTTGEERQQHDQQNDRRRLVQLPVICFDALLPHQELQGQAEDPLFCEFLRDEVGIGGWFVMTSLNYFTRTIRRHGTVVKLVGMDAPTTTPTNNNNTSTGGKQQQQQKRGVPTAVDFSLVGHSRCRVVGSRKEMTQRIGRWRRAYDPNGEETMLGWGEERFTDASDELSTAMIPVEDVDTDGRSLANNNRRSRKEWSDCWVEVQLEQVEKEQGEDSLPEEVISLQERLPNMVDEWYALASNIGTYDNTNVTASTRVKTGMPGLYVEPEKLLQRVTNQLGPRPSVSEDPTAFCFWVAALINPLPVLGVSLEIRGKLQEAATIERRLRIVEMGLRRSIDNLTGKAPL